MADYPVILGLTLEMIQSMIHGLYGGYLWLYHYPHLHFLQILVAARWPL